MYIWGLSPNVQIFAETLRLRLRMMPGAAWSGLRRAAGA